VIGIEERDTKLGVHVVRLHYTADPTKRSAEWQAEVRRGLKDRAWNREYEIDWTIASGLGVYSEYFDREIHVARTQLSPYADKPIFRGWDFGLSPACAWIQIDPMGRVNVLSEEVTWNGRNDQRQMGIENFCPVVQLTSAELFPGYEFKDWADPAGWQRSQTDETTCVQIMQRFGFNPTPGPVTWTARRDAMHGILTKYVGGRAGIVIDPRCSMLIEGFQGKYQFERIGQSETYRESVAKNAWSHVMNSLEYIIGSLFKVRRDRQPEKVGLFTPKHIEKLMAGGKI